MCDAFDLLNCFDELWRFELCQSKRDIVDAMNVQQATGDLEDQLFADCELSHSRIAVQDDDQGMLLLVEFTSK